MDLQKHTEPDLRKHTDLRASDADRDRIADMLRDAHAEGRLTADEHAERVEEVFRAKTVGELEPLVRDLPAAHRPRPSAAFAAAPSRPVPGAIPPVADENVVAVFSGAVRRGRWRVGRRTHAYAIFGSVEIDLSEAIFEHQQVVIKAISVFGSVEVRVPENVSLRGSGGGVLGSFEVDTLDSGDQDAPVVYVDGLAVLGSIEAKPKRGKLIEDILDRVTDKVNAKLRKHLGH
ncbi:MULTISPECIES: DUF1707 SHOCT-like domain-containing protein [Streptomyces]|uniref:DUF1707 SHOCT-like domain-containing protein n=1 Tax=Streptomyces TaxID=1883 RepID=UPI00200E1C37|nr:DUF1707 domain-containing protein [Streptomyces sp. LRE541]UPZ29207.1 DUF1707 domain-containing protein [Streptomyces sp. LRE541]